jgi:hypothetical protein
MAMTYQITPKRRLRQIQHVMQVGDAETITLNLSSWIAANSAITSATWTLKSGDVSLGTPATTSPTTSCVITAASQTRARIVVKCTAGTQILSTTILIKVEEPQDIGTYDYGWIAP